MADAPKLNTPVTYVAIFVLVSFGAITYVLYTMIETTNEATWHRLIFLYGGIEAIAFAAAGYLFGREVSRKHAENAEERADQKTQEAEDAKKKGHELKGLILGRKGATALRDLRDLPRGERTGSDLDELAARAQELFP
jgi:hypothetical protein